MSDHMSKKEKREREWDSIFMITNRCLDVTIMFLTTFAFIYLCNGNYLTAVILIILDAIVVPINNGPQAFHWVHAHVSAWHQNLNP